VGFSVLEYNLFNLDHNLISKLETDIISLNVLLSLWLSITVGPSPNNNIFEFVPSGSQEEFITDSYDSLSARDTKSSSRIIAIITRSLNIIVLLD
jgi:hypothetical protein